MWPKANSKAKNIPGQIFPATVWRRESSPCLNAWDPSCRSQMLCPLWVYIRRGTISTLGHPCAIMFLWKEIWGILTLLPQNRETIRIPKQVFQLRQLFKWSSSFQYLQDRTAFSKQLCPLLSPWMTRPKTAAVKQNTNQPAHGKISQLAHVKLCS